MSRRKTKYAALAGLSIACLTVGEVRGALIDDFSSTSLSAQYTTTTVLDQGATRNVTFQSPSGALQGKSTGTDGAEQTLLLRSDFTLPVGSILRADVGVVGSGLSQDLGIAVASTAAPTITNLNGSQRSDYVFVGFRGDNTHLISSGFNGTTGLGTNQVFGLGLTGVYIRRDATNTFVVGYNSGGGPDVDAFTYTIANSAVGNAVGFYTDERASNTVGNLDNLSVSLVPEPASLGLVGLGALGVFRRKSRSQEV